MAHDLLVQSGGCTANEENTPNDTYASALKIVTNHTKGSPVLPNPDRIMTQSSSVFQCLVLRGWYRVAC